ncbi:MAG: gamma-glutamyltransferase, partial [Acidobacteriota bacterium]
GESPEKGEIFRNPDLAKTYRLIAGKGRDAYYKGEIAKRIVEYSKKAGGYFSLSDFSEFKSEWVEPMGVEFMGYKLWELPPNGQGLAALQMLKMLKGMDLKKMGHNSAEYLHALVEIKKIVYEDRAKFYADPAFSKIDYEAFITDEYTNERLKLFDNNKASSKLKTSLTPPEKGDTIYLTVVDRDRNVVSLIQSNYFGFGSGMVPDGLGFCIQDRGALFSLDKDHYNSFEPGKRPFHTIIPAMVTRNGKPVFSFGVMGGSMQPQGHVQVLLNILVFGMNIQEAGDAARFRHGGSSQPDSGVMTDGGIVFLESGVLPGVIRDLISLGHKVSSTRGGYGGYQGIWIDRAKGVLFGGSESRKDGAAIGY